MVVVHHGWAGTHEYLDPCYEQLGQLCALSDVYGLGLIMCQLLMVSVGCTGVTRGEGGGLCVCGGGGFGSGLGNRGGGGLTVHPSHQPTSHNSVHEAG
jgi:hypothetical protein